MVFPCSGSVLVSASGVRLFGNTRVEYAIVKNKREESQLSLPARRTCNKLAHQFL
jgi:hypothetical protein